MRRWLTELIFLCLVAAPAAAQSNTAGVVVALTARDQVAYVGDTVLINVIVVNAENPEAPAIEFPRGFSAQSLARQDSSVQFMTNINGRRNVRREHRFTFPFAVTPQSPGRFSIGPASVRAGGEVYESDTLELVVQEPQPRDDLQLRLAIDQESAYVGETVMLTVTWMMRSNIGNQFEFKLPGLPPSLEVHDVPTAPPNAHDIRAGRFAELEFLGSTVLAERGTVVEGGVEWTTYTFRKSIVAATPGEFEIGPAYFRGGVEVGRRRNGLFGDEPVHERAVVPSETVRLRVLPLPTSGQPDDFSGLVGVYRVTSRLDRTEMKVGDPVRLSIRITGPAPIERARTVGLLNQPQLTSEFRVSPDDTTTRVDGGTLLIETTIRAVDERVDELPSLSFPYFDPELGAYQVAASRPIAVTVQPTRIVTMDDAVGAARAARSLDSNIGGFAHSYPIDLSRASTRFDALAWIQTPLGAGALAAPPVFWALALGVAAVRRFHDRRAQSAPQTRAVAHARSAIQRAATASDIAVAFATYAHRRLRLSPTPSPDEVADALRDQDAELSDRARSLMQRFDETRFAGAAPHATDALRDEALQTLSAIEDAVRRTSR